MIISLDSSFSSLIPHFCLGVVTASIKPTDTYPALRSLMNQEAECIQKRLRIEQIKELPTIAYTRSAYKLLGKDPNRYRPASEQLMRRVVSGKGLYFINAAVDLGNLLSLQTGYSIGVFDRTLVEGDVQLRVGRSSDTFEGIGRGILNIEGLPTYQDSAGPFATPTSDSERTKVRANTSQLLIFINHYVPLSKEGASLPPQSLREAVELAMNYLSRFVEGWDMSYHYLLPGMPSVSIP